MTRADADWNVAWDEHRAAQMTAAMEATPAQRLAWLEEMLRLAYRSGALPHAADVHDDSEGV